MFKIRFKGRNAGETEMEQEQTLLVAARRAQVDIGHRCGGHARCGTCKVTVTEGAEQLSEMGASEKRVLGLLNAGETDRLACQAWAKGDVTCQVD